MDSQALLGGQDWDTAIFRAFRDAKVFLTWISRVCILEIHFKPEQVGPYAWGRARHRFRSNLSPTCLPTMAHSDSPRHAVRISAPVTVATLRGTCRLC